MATGDPAGRSTSSPWVPAAIPAPSAPPTTEPSTALLLFPPRIFPGSAPPAALPPMIPAVFFVDLGATLVMLAEIGATNPSVVATLSNARLNDPALLLSPFLAGIASLTRP